MTIDTYLWCRRSGHRFISTNICLAMLELRSGMHMACKKLWCTAYAPELKDQFISLTVTSHPWPQDVTHLLYLLSVHSLGLYRSANNSVWAANKIFPRIRSNPNQSPWRSLTTAEFDLEPLRYADLPFRCLLLQLWDRLCLPAYAAGTSCSCGLTGGATNEKLLATQAGLHTLAALCPGNCPPVGHPVGCIQDGLHWCAGRSCAWLPPTFHGEFRSISVVLLDHCVAYIFTLAGVFSTNYNTDLAYSFKLGIIMDVTICFHDCWPNRSPMKGPSASA